MSLEGLLVISLPFPSSRDPGRYARVLLEALTDYKMASAKLRLPGQSVDPCAITLVRVLLEVLTDYKMAGAKLRLSGKAGWLQVRGDRFKSDSSAV